MLTLTVLSLSPIERDPLALGPAPSAYEWLAISESIRKDTTTPVTSFQPGTTLHVLDSYRGHLLYCAGYVTVHRYSPQTSGGNGFAGWPTDGLEEDVYINNSCKARVKFNVGL